MYRRIAIVMVILLVVLLVDTGKPAKVVVDLPERTWVTQDSKAYAQDVVLSWAQNQYKCLDLLWSQESNWRPSAYNKTKVMGKNAGGIPQLLGMSPKLSPPLQIDRGFAYIMHRYGTPCKAWKFHQRKGWY